MENASNALRILDPEQEGGDVPAGFFRRAVDLPVRDEVLRIVVDVPDRPLRLAEAVPLVHAIDDRLVAVYLRQAERGRKPIYCRRGCSACCERFLIIFSPAEMYYLRERIEAFPPERRQRVLDWFDAQADRARRGGLIDRLRNLPTGEDPMDAIERWWRQQDRTACPFLHAAEGVCGLYGQRFVACREYYSQAPRDHCARRATARMPMPLNLMSVLWQLEQRLTGEPIGAMSLPFFKLWSDLRKDQARRTWPAVQVVDTLLDILAETAAAARQLSAGAIVDATEQDENDGPT
ncbi:MAG TPA: hypothetical protein VM695_08990 [Phycisphaerae bacterium]|nr:hypothetical protein [Phycisphaerae bacterium]